MLRRALPLDPQELHRHFIHGDGRVWIETNCYVDLWVELLHALGHEPSAALGFTVAIDFEGDQWTFFKFPPADLRDMYDVDVQELAIFRPIPAHLDEQLARGRPVLIELDSYYLPDTQGSAYRRAHVKTTVGVTEIDVNACRLGYFHAQGYHYLEGDDYVSALRVGDDDPAALPPYAEIVKVLRRPRRSRADTLRISLNLFRRHLAMAPRGNPFEAFHARFERDLPGLVELDIDAFHQYAFATLRQCGACFELTATYLGWLQDFGEPVAEPKNDFQELAVMAKTFQFQLARAIGRRRGLDAGPLLEMARIWDRGMSMLKTAYLARA